MRRPRLWIDSGACIPLRSHLPSEGTAQPFAVATRSAGRGTREAGSTRVGDAATAFMDDWVVHPAAGSHLPAEDTAQPFAVAFASSPFAHPIPQSRRRARVGSVQRFLDCGGNHAASIYFLLQSIFTISKK